MKMRPMHAFIDGGTEAEKNIVGPALLYGSFLFGLGWGMLGICPGPSIVGLAAPLVAAAKGDADAASRARGGPSRPRPALSCRVRKESKN